MRRLDEAGIPFAVKSVNDTGLALEAAGYARRSGVAHNIILRFTNPGGAANDVPEYDLSAPKAARNHWERVLASVPPEFDEFKDLVWLEPVNELDKNRADWLGSFAHHLGQLALADGYRLAMFGMNAGEPEPEQWELPGMLQYLQDCAAHPDRLSISLHEAKLEDMNAPIESYFPHLIGRFRYLYDVCDRRKFARPTTFISEWAWSYNDMPEPASAMEDVKWVSELVAGYPSLRAVYLWNLAGGPQWANLPNRLQRLIAPITVYTLAARFPDPEPIEVPDEDEDDVVPPVEPGDGEDENGGGQVDEGSRGTPRVQYKRTYVLLHPSMDRTWVEAVAAATWASHHFTIGVSADDAGAGDLDDKMVVVVNPDLWGAGEDGRGIAGFYETYYPGVRYLAVTAGTARELQAALAAIEW
jgi:hypothetical protein